MKHLPSSLADWIKQGDEQRQKRRKRPVSRLAVQMAALSGVRLKHERASILASVADRIYALSIPKTRERL